MAQLFNMPQLGSTMEEGLVVLWNRHEGEPIHKGDVLLEVETDKTIVEVQSPCDGVLHKILAQPETRVPIHQPVAILGAEHEDITTVLAGLNLGNTEKQRGDEPQPSAARAHISHPASPGSTSIAISPRARRLADEEKVPLAALAGCGTGPGGRVIERDVLTYLQEYRKPQITAADPSTPQIEAPASRGDQIAFRSALRAGNEPIADVNELALGLPGSRVRPEDVLAPPSSARLPMETAPPSLRKVQHTHRSQSLAVMTLEVDMTACLAFRDQLLSEVTRTYNGVLDCVHIVVKAAARTLEMYPLLNAVLVDEAIQPQRHINIVVSTPVEDKLVTQVVQQVDRKTLGEVSAALSGSGDNQPDQALADIVQSGFAITALTDEIDRFYPTVPAGHVAAFGLGRIGERPIAVAGQIVAHPTMNLCLAYNSDILDLASAARFLQRMKELLEAPPLILV